LGKKEKNRKASKKKDMWQNIRKFERKGRRRGREKAGVVKCSARPEGGGKKKRKEKGEPCVFALAYFAVLHHGKGEVWKKKEKHNNQVYVFPTREGREGGRKKTVISEKERRTGFTSCQRRKGKMGGEEKKKTQYCQ